jgi:hypothetical protein
MYLVGGAQTDDKGINTIFCAGAGTGARTRDEAALLAAPAHLTGRDRLLVRWSACTGC